MKLNETLMAAVGVGVAGGIVAAGENGGWTGGALAAVFALMAGVAVVTALISTRLSSGIVAREELAAEEAQASAAV